MQEITERVFLNAKGQGLRNLLIRLDDLCGRGWTYHYFRSSYVFCVGESELGLGFGIQDVRRRLAPVRVRPLSCGHIVSFQVTIRERGKGVPESAPLVEFRVQIIDISPSATFVNGMRL